MVYDESCAAVGGAMVGMETNDQSVSTSDNVYVVNYGMKNTFTGDDDGKGTAITNDIISDKILVRKKGKTVKEDSSFLNDRDIVIYKYNGDSSHVMKSLFESLDKEDNRDDETAFYEMITGREMLSEDQIAFDKEFSLYNVTHTSLTAGAVLETMVEQFRDLTGRHTYYFPVMSERDKNIQEQLQKVHKTALLYEDVNGYFIYDTATDLRTKSVPIETIKEYCVR